MAIIRYLSHEPMPPKGAEKTAEQENWAFDGDWSLDAFDADLRLDFFLSI